MRHQTPNSDEVRHLKYGQQILALNSNRLEVHVDASNLPTGNGWRVEADGPELKLRKADKVQPYEVLRSQEDSRQVLVTDDSKMPVSALNAFPGMIASHLPVARLQTSLRSLFTARLVTIIISMLLGYLCFHWSRQVYGVEAGIFTLFLYAFEPNIIAHSQRITTDLYAAATITLALYAAWRYSLVKDSRHAAALGLAVGFSQLAKYSGVFLLVLLPMTLVLADAKQIIRMVSMRDCRACHGYVLRSLGHGCLIVVIVLLMINTGYFFNRTLTPLEDYRFQSEFFQSIHSLVSVLNFLPVPLPYPYLEGLDLVSLRERTGFGFGRTYLLGQLSQEGFVGYYLIAFLFKVPIALQLVCLLVILSYLGRWKRFRFGRAELFMLMPILFFSIYFNFFYRAQIGIRFLLVIFPCILVFCGRLVENWGMFNRRRKLGIFVLSGYLVLSVLSYFPHYIPYFNELIYDRRYGYKILADSNIDWGQSKTFLTQYLERYPETKVEPDSPVAGRIVVRVNQLTGVTGDPARYAWLRDNLLPSETIAYSYLVYNVSPAELEAISR
jgi:Dolichyl-phosphate-mannose-protein mannosyltransferase